MEIAKIHQTSVESLDGSMSFPEVIQILSRIGLESYHVDLVENRKTYHMPDGKFYTEDFYFDGPKISAVFSEEKVIEAIRAVQKEKIRYKDFLNFVMLAGVTNYSVYLNAKKVIYFGRDGDFHVERFPSK